eukprot:scaffold224925_cov30-Tisochrysis_lutea.AAC.2
MYMKRPMSTPMLRRPGSEILTVMMMVRNCLAVLRIRKMRITRSRRTTRSNAAGNGSTPEAMAVVTMSNKHLEHVEGEEDDVGYCRHLIERLGPVGGLGVRVVHVNAHDRRVAEDDEHDAQVKLRRANEVEEGYTPHLPRRVGPAVGAVFEDRLLSTDPLALLLRHEGEAVILLLQHEAPQNDPDHEEKGAERRQRVMLVRAEGPVRLLGAQPEGHHQHRVAHIVEVAKVGVGPLREFGVFAVVVRPVRHHHALVVVALPVEIARDYAVRGQPVRMPDARRRRERVDERIGDNAHVLGARDQPEGADGAEGTQRTERGHFLVAVGGDGDDGDEDDGEVNLVPVVAQVRRVARVSRVDEAEGDDLERHLQDKDSAKDQVAIGNGAFQPKVLVPAGPIDAKEDRRDGDEHEDGPLESAVPHNRRRESPDRATPGEEEERPVLALVVCGRQLWQLLCFGDTRRVFNRQAVDASPPVDAPPSSELGRCLEDSVAAKDVNHHLLRRTLRLVQPLERLGLLRGLLFLPILLHVDEQDGDEEVEEDQVTHHKQKQKVERGDGIAILVRGGVLVEVNLVPVLTREDHEDGQEGAKEGVKVVGWVRIIVRPGRLHLGKSARVVGRRPPLVEPWLGEVAGEQLHTEEREDDHEEHEQDEEVDDGDKGLQ